MSFNDYNLSPKLLKSLQKLQFDKPTSIQEKAIPVGLEGSDIVAQSQTGSGKTLAFSIPMIQNIKPKAGVQAIVLTPTRELAVQVTEAINDYSQFTPIKAESIYGGVSYDPQIRALKKAEIIVATPGRLIDHIDRQNTDFSNVKFVVLDEADKMVEMGFLEDTETIIDEIETNPQIFLFSATFPEKINYFVDEYLSNPVFIKTEKFVSNKLLTQNYYKVHGTQKFGLLVHLLEEEDNSIVFCSTRKESDFVTYNLKKNGVRAKAIHGGHTQAKRLKSIEHLHDGKISVLVATDVASRGLDIKNITKIFNWDIPKAEDDYTHRIGRTARAGEEGEAISFVTDRDKESFNSIQRIHKNVINRLKTPKIENLRMIRDESLLKEEKEQRRHYESKKPSKGKKKFNRNFSKNNFNKSNKFKGKKKKIVNKAIAD